MLREIQEIQVACFFLGADLYAIDIMRIKEIIRPLKMTSLPKFPSFVEGIINLRGTVMPVVDLRRRFDLASQEVTFNTRLLIVSLSGQIIALVVDEVTEVVSVAVNDIKPPPQIGEAVDADYLLGVCLVKQDMIMLLNIDSLFSSHEATELGRMQTVLQKTAASDAKSIMPA